MSRQRVTIIDYGMGNIWSVTSALRYLNCEVVVSSDPLAIQKAESLILPGVGSFRKAMKALRDMNLEAPIIESALVRKVKFLGICLGMQLMGVNSTEDGLTSGLNLIPSKVDKFSPAEIVERKVPHIGFNQVNIDSSGNLFKGISGNQDFYFVHSYRMLPPDSQGIVSTCNYGIDFLAAYESQNLFATQFHPEKSQSNGLKLLDNFLKA
jgi:imidazole glycerol-phosphate synthase subunit HisH